MADRLHVTIEGDVQGVGFRQSTWSKAQRLGLSGWVRNRPEGDVEAEFEGDKEALEEMLTWCQQGPPAAMVANVRERWESGPAKHQSFEIRF